MSIHNHGVYDIDRDEIYDPQYRQVSNINSQRNRRRRRRSRRRRKQNNGCLYFIIAGILICALSIGIRSCLSRDSDPKNPAQSVSSATSGITEPEQSTSAPARTEPVTLDTLPEETTAAEELATEPYREPWYLILVNRDHPLPEDYSVELTTLSNGKQVDSRMYPALQKMFDDMRDADVYPIVRSAYRTSEDQQSIMNNRIQQYRDEGYSKEDARIKAEEWVALPGTSEHETGLAVDINADGVNSGGDEVYDWLLNHAHEYGFIKRYAEDKIEITGISNEPWHYRYVGVEAAREMKERNLCLEEYLQ